MSRTAALSFAFRRKQSAQGFGDRAQLVSGAQDYALAVFRYGFVEREHMRADHVSLYPVQTKIPPRVFKRASGVGKSVKSVGFVGRVPIVQEIVVKKRASDEGACVMPEGEPFGYVDAERCHKKGVRVYAESAVLYIFFFFLHSGGGKNISPEKTYFVFCFSEFFQGFLRVMLIIRVLAESFDRAKLIINIEYTAI